MPWLPVFFTQETTMANFSIGYDLNGPLPTHKDVDEHIRKGFTTRGRVLETQWYIAFDGTTAQVRDYMMKILRKEDRLYVTKCTAAAWNNLLVTDASLKAAFEKEIA
jgi:hypothetical protein